MTNHDRDKDRGISLVEAVDALSAIAEMDLNPGNIDILQEDDAQKINQYRALTSKGGSLDIGAVREIFDTIYHHLNDLYKDESSYVIDESKNERVKTIMILVGEAASKLDRLTDLFHETHMKSVHELKEYKQLQEFYIDRIARKIDHEMLGKWIFGIAYGKGENEAAPLPQKPLHTNHVFIDLDGVKKDSEYELFFIKKEDGTRFFNPKLIRSIKLISDFGSYFKAGEKTDDPFADLDLLVDRSLYVASKNMTSNLKSVMDRFYKEAAIHKQNEMVQELHKVFIALLLASNSKNLLRNNPTKSCSEYFTDFQEFFRNALKTRDYQRIQAYPEKENVLNNCLKSTVEALAFLLYTQKPGLTELAGFIENLIHEAVHEQSEEHKKASVDSKMLWSQLASDYAAMNKLIKRHPNGHLKKILEMVSLGNYKYYNPLFQQNLPMEFYNLFYDDYKMVNIRLPSPTYQENIQKAVIDDEFKVFLQSLKGRWIPSKLLVFNYQDRTSWQEHARAKVLEDLQKNPEFSSTLSVVTIAKDTEFYNQDSPYDVDNKAEDFIQHFKEHLSDESAGFCFPKAISKQILGKFTNEAMRIIHHLFFHSKNVLTKEQRLDFIEIFYFFLELKVLDLVKPNFYSLTCKDAVDISNASNVHLFAFLNILNQEKFSENDMELINLMLYGPSVIVRERLMLTDRFNRMLSALRVFESVKEEFSSPQIFSKIIKEAFVLLYDTPILDAKIQPLR